MLVLALLLNNDLFVRLSSSKLDKPKVVRAWHLLVETTYLAVGQISLGPRIEPAVKDENDAALLDIMVAQVTVNRDISSFATLRYGVVLPDDSFDCLKRF